MKAAISIKRVYKVGDVCRYRVTLRAGEPMEFLIGLAGYEKVSDKEWAAAFAQALSGVLAKMAERLR